MDDQIYYVSHFLMKTESNTTADSAEKLLDTVLYIQDTLRLNHNLILSITSDLSDCHFTETSR